MSENKRFDNTGHWLEFDNKDFRSRCKQCGMLTHAFCKKCIIHLCFNRNRNCFRSYHLSMDGNCAENGEKNKNVRQHSIKECRKEKIIKSKRSRRGVLQLGESDQQSISTRVTASTIVERYCEKKRITKYGNSRYFLRHRVNDSRAEEPLYGTSLRNTSQIKTAHSCLESYEFTQGNGNKDLKYHFFAYLHLTPNT